MNEEQAKKYLVRKGQEPTKKNIQQVMKEGKIYGDPTAEVDFE